MLNRSSEPPFLSAVFLLSACLHPAVMCSRCTASPCCAQHGGFGDAALGSFGSSSPRLWGSMAENLGASIPLGAGWRGPEGWEALSWVVPALPPPAPAPQGLQQPLGKGCSIPGIPQRSRPLLYLPESGCKSALQQVWLLADGFSRAAKEKKEGEGKPQSPPIKEAGWGRRSPTAAASRAGAALFW